MNRRRFLKVLSATVLAPVLPAIGEPRCNPLFANRFSTWSGITIKRFPIERRDFGYIVQLGAEAFVHRRREHFRVRLGLELHARHWEKFNARQREETWELLERRVVQSLTPARLALRQSLSQPTA